MLEAGKGLSTVQQTGVKSICTSNICSVVHHPGWWACSGCGGRDTLPWPEAETALLGRAPEQDLAGYVYNDKWNNGRSNAFGIGGARCGWLDVHCLHTTRFELRGERSTASKYENSWKIMKSKILKRNIVLNRTLLHSFSWKKDSSCWIRERCTTFSPQWFDIDNCVLCLFTVISVPLLCIPVSFHTNDTFRLNLAGEIYLWPSGRSAERRSAHSGSIFSWPSFYLETGFASYKLEDVFMCISRKEL